MVKKIQNIFLLEPFKLSKDIFIILHKNRIQIEIYLGVKNNYFK